jgi:hypothetical protein
VNHVTAKAGTLRSVTIKFIGRARDVAGCVVAQREWRSYLYRECPTIKRKATFALTGTRNKFWASDLPRYFLISLLSFAAVPVSVVPIGAQSDVKNAVPQYLLFHLYSGSVDPTTGVASLTMPAILSFNLAQSIVATVQVPSPAPNRILGFDFGPISMDQGAVGAISSINEAFNIALSTNLAVAIHLDDRMFWKNATFPDGTSLLATPGTTEWTDWNGDPAPPLSIPWLPITNLAPPMCYESPPVQAWTQYWLGNVIGPAIVAGYQRFIAAGKANLFAGVFAGWESNIVYGYCSLSHIGFSASNPPANFDYAAEEVLQAHISQWAQYLAEAGIPTNRIYTHEAWPTIQPFAAFNSYSSTGWTNYNWPDSFDQIYSVTNSNPWVQAEGSNVTLGNCPSGACPSPYDWETYLAASYNHGASLVTIFGAFPAESGAYSTAIGAQAVAAYKKFLRGATLVEHTSVQ